MRRALVLAPFVLVSGTALGVCAPTASAEPLPVPTPLSQLLTGPSPTPSPSASPTASPSSSAPSSSATTSTRSGSVVTRVTRPTVRSESVRSGGAPVALPQTEDDAAGVTVAPPLGAVSLAAATPAPRTTAVPAPLVAAEDAPTAPTELTASPATPRDGGVPAPLTALAVLTLAATVGGHALMRFREVGR